jgi:uncharacterized repeat protein (TIGR01451 family)
VQNFTLTVNQAPPACQPGMKGCQPVPPSTAVPPKLSKAFAYATTKAKLSFNVGDTTALTFTISNQDPATSLTGVGFTDTLPAGLIISTPAALSGSCGGGAIAATVGSSVVSLADAAVEPLSSCSFSLSVTATSTGLKTNTTSAVTSPEAGSGNVALIASGTRATRIHLAPPDG